MKISGATTLLAIGSAVLGRFVGAEDGEPQDPDDVGNFFLCVMQDKTQCETSPECEWITGDGCSLNTHFCGFDTQPFCENFNACFWDGEECAPSVAANQVVEGGFVASGLERSRLDEMALNLITTIVSNTFRAGYAVVEVAEGICAGETNCNPNFDFANTDFIPMAAGEAADLALDPDHHHHHHQLADSSSKILVKFLITYPDLEGLERMLSLLDGDENTAITNDLKSAFNGLFFDDIGVFEVTAVPSKTFTSLQFMQKFDSTLHTKKEFTDALCKVIGSAVGLPCGEQLQIGAPHANPSNDRMVVIVRVHTSTDSSIDILQQFSTKKFLIAVQAQIASSSDSLVTPLVIAEIMAGNDEHGGGTSNRNDLLSSLGGAGGVAGVGVGVAACATALVALMVQQRRRNQLAAEKAEVESAADCFTASAQRDFDSEPAFANELLQTEFQDELGMPGQIDLEVHSRDKKNFVFLPSHSSSNFDTDTDLDEC